LVKKEFFAGTESWIKISVLVTGFANILVDTTSTIIGTFNTFRFSLVRVESKDANTLIIWKGSVESRSTRPARGSIQAGLTLRLAWKAIVIFRIFKKSVKTHAVIVWISVFAFARKTLIVLVTFFAIFITDHTSLTI
jgi:hypothetical protein